LEEHFGDPGSLWLKSLRGISFDIRYVVSVCATIYRNGSRKGGLSMAWTTPTLVEICIGLEINGYLPAEF
jgi:coenzyme PQQ precursor peptide PqqA